VPSPGLRLAGLRLADSLLTQTRGPGRLVDSGYLAALVYSADPSRLGTGEPLLQVEAALRGPAGDSYRRSFAASRSRLAGPGYDARLTDAGPILRYHGTYVLVSLCMHLAPRRLRSVLIAIARS